jgi:hypothetical protein
VTLTHVEIPTELFVLPLKGTYEMAIAALAYKFDKKGLTSPCRTASLHECYARVAGRLSG